MRGKPSWPRRLDEVGSKPLNSLRVLGLGVTLFGERVVGPRSFLHKPTPMRSRHHPEYNSFRA